MKVLMKTTVAAAILSTAFFANAAEAQQKIGVVSMQNVLQQLPQTQQISARLQEEFASDFAELEKMTTELQGLQEKAERDAQIMSPTERLQLSREIELLETRRQLKYKALREDSERRQQEERNKLMRDIVREAQALAQAQGYDMVLNDGSVLYATEALDLTNAVLQKMTAGN
ncbi:OmpH family outer membrane protein [Pseudidiomarina terrestris]|uniref:OmpH family outer membrane protein n=1 Tax=Pseudidiomarina terrestris TaxID=2820060 RepID=A0AAW7QTJ8_9GAMM|nr:MULTISPECIES: OmpH family outer membrane protein [unclassified Pseudidiomarina]MDN7123560.1 OmpH family outer membrane protein [Pseudidiomarina sp. 1APP75-32.1]MDN7126650.1 OmpH family outer membrane protein [Pseudidiomarina sp. 1APR75-33.1]MDN7128716.1 OmpH family outer membrane protein [Pseudidiomarina sp. 1APR75-15]MDN7135025.1 OmpH family outer membrane protein [Pseudidiomarina sp. 1ASP75-5]MDN7137696.1 OmpH family outer membrane protein [Pseudidiomarina sp. 1ASP75-14]